MRTLIVIALLILSAGDALAQSRGAPGTPPASAPTRPAPIEPETPRETPRSIEIPEAVQNGTLASEREVLILVDLINRRETQDTLEQNDFTILRTHFLNEIDHAMFVVEADQNTLARLRTLLPEAEIDMNADLSASKGPRLYAKDKINWPDQGTCLDKAIKIPIGLIDGSIDRSHPAFAGQRIFEQNFLGGQIADKNHATAITSILIGNAPDQGFDGLLTGAKLYNAVALRRALNDEQLASIEAVLRGLDWLMGKDIRLINVSLAGKKNRVMTKAFEASLERGSLIFAAAGNNGPSAPPTYPAAIDGVFAVSAIDVSGKTYKHANRGNYIDFSAPGVDIWTATPGASGGYKSGTSYAVPYALGASALHLSKNSQLSSSVLIQIMNAKISIDTKC
ncbi:MAG: S8 family serine peptidase [Pseudomonadota bacterium]